MAKKTIPKKRKKVQRKPLLPEIVRLKNDFERSPLSQEQLADAVGVKRRTVYNIFEGYHVPRLSIYEKMRNAIDRSVA